MDTQLLSGIVTFKQVVDCGSFTEAAALLDHSKSYISNEISKLEKRLGVRLLNRTTRALRLTAAGEIYYRQCQNIVHDALQVERQLSGQQFVPKGNLRISCPVSFALAKIKPMLGEYMERYPEVTVELELNDQLVDIVADGYDLVLRASDRLPDSSFVSRKLTSVDIVTIVAPNYLKKWGMPRSPDDLVHHRTINFRSTVNQNIWQYQDEDGRQSTVKVESHLITNSAEMGLALCKSAQGIARVPKLILTDEIEKGDLVFLFNEFMPVTADIFLIYPNRKYLSSTVRSFIDFIVENIE